MITGKTFSWCAKILAFVLLATCVTGAATAVDAVPEVRTVSDTYKNVTLISKTETHVFVEHSRGTATLKIESLDHDSLVSLGVLQPEVEEAPATFGSSSNLVETLAPLGKFAESLPASLHGQNPVNLKLSDLPPEFKNYLLIAAAIFLFLHLFFSYCSMLICKKAGSEPGFLVWLPVFQMIPLIRAAGMSGWWFLACFVPVLNIVAQVLWSINISKARGKGSFTAVMLILPVTNLFAFLYLAFAGGESDVENSSERVRFEPLPA